MDLLLATNNPDKVRELMALLDELPLLAVGPRQLAPRRGTALLELDLLPDLLGPIDNFLSFAFLGPDTQRIIL